MTSRIIPSPLAAATEASRLPRHTAPIDLKFVGKMLCHYPNRALLQKRIAELHGISHGRVIATSGGVRFAAGGRARRE